jgi:hypothetical protein
MGMDGTTTLMMTKARAISTDGAGARSAVHGPSARLTRSNLRLGNEAVRHPRCFPTLHE